MMDQFDNLIDQGIYDVIYSGGFGNIAQSVEPFIQARLLAQKAAAMRPNALAPIAGEVVASRIGFYAMAREWEDVKEFNFMLSLADVDRAAVPFPDYNFITYPPADQFRSITEKRAKYRNSTDLVVRDPKASRLSTSLINRCPCHLPTKPRWKM